MNEKQIIQKLKIETDLEFESHYYDSYIWFIADHPKNENLFIRIDFPENQSYDYDFNLNDTICITLIDIDHEFIDQIEYQ